MECRVGRQTGLTASTPVLDVSAPACTNGAWLPLRPVSVAQKNVLRIVTGCLRPTPEDNLPTLTGIQPAELRRNGATLSLARRAVEPGHLLHAALARPSSADARRLKSRHPFVRLTQHLISPSDNNNISAAQWVDHQWNAEWADNHA